MNTGIKEIQAKFKALLDSNPIDWANYKKLAENCWLFLTNDKLPNKATIKKDAFLHEVSIMIDCACQMAIQEYKSQSLPKKYPEDMEQYPYEGICGKCCNYRHKLDKDCLCELCKMVGVKTITTNAIPEEIKRLVRLRQSLPVDSNVDEAAENLVKAGDFILSQTDILPIVHEHGYYYSYPNICTLLLRYASQLNRTEK